jgi:hypothetical protein
MSYQHCPPYRSTATCIVPDRPHPLRSVRQAGPPHFFPLFPLPCFSKKPMYLRKVDKDPPPPAFESKCVTKLLPTLLSMSPATVIVPPRWSPPRSHCHRPFTVSPSSRTFSRQSDRCLTPTSPSLSSRYTLKPLLVTGAARQILSASCRRPRTVSHRPSHHA